MGFLTRLLAGLTAAAALGAGLTGTANAADVTGTTGNTKSVVKLTDDGTNNLPDHIVNGSFDYPSVPSWTVLPGSDSNKYNKGKLYATINPGTGKYGSGCDMSTSGRPIPNWNRSSFAWSSTQGDTHYPNGTSCEAGNVELNYDSVHHNQFGELTADQQGTAIYQDVKVTPGTAMKWSLKHSSTTSAYVDKMQVMIGEPYKETAQEATRIASENGNKVGEKMTTISTPTTSDRADNKKWDTYSGTYLVPDGVTTVRFTFKSVASAEWYSGNDLDDIEFSRSYKLTYDKNSSDAAGEVPSNQRGKENTTQPAKDKTSGTVRLASDDDVVEYAANGLPKQIMNGDFDHDWRNIVGQSKMSEKYNFANIDPAHGDVEISGALNNKGEASKQWVHLNGFDASQFGWKSNQTDTRVDGRGGIVEIQRSRANKLSYDKNSQDASGQIPSDETANTVKQAKAKSSGGVRLAADRTDGKVSDLVQRTTTHEDGSVTVRTVDTTTDVVSGCQVYYPAGQKITLATLAKDNDCWDSSMLSRPGHTQLGWNQDSQATQAQAQVTMVEGGMTVYAVWVGNPVLTYDTNKPNTWNGQMPSTPASVSVSYNTAAADGSGWQSGDTSKIRGYRFLGWYAGPQDDAGLYDWNTLLTGNVTVYAHWQRLQANVVYDANGGTGSHANTTGWQYSDVTVPSDTSKSFKRDGYYFKYWNTQKDGKGTTYKDSAQVPLQDKNVTLYAIWAPYHTVITETGGIGLPVLVTGGIVLLVMGIGSTVMLTRRMRGER